MSTITILHFSDIHFKKKKEKKDKFFREQVKTKMIEAIREHLGSGGVVPEVAVITGDIAFSGKKDEYKEARSFFDDLKKVLPAIPFLVVPGNHDVDRTAIDKYSPMFDNVIQKELIEDFLTDESCLKGKINVKFVCYKEFANSLDPSLYPGEADYYWIKEFRDKEVSILGLNSSWASEGDKDQTRIALGYPQLINALSESKQKNKILLMHHPLFDWFDKTDSNKCRGEIFGNCRLVLHGHSHRDDALVFNPPNRSCIALGANASYTRDEDGFIGFQLIRAEFGEGVTTVTVWPYKLEERDRLRFVPDTSRWEGQDSQKYFELYSYNKPPIMTPATGGKDNKKTGLTPEPAVFDLTPCAGVSIADIDGGSIREFVQQMDETRSHSIFYDSFEPDIEAAPFLEKTGLMTEGALTNAAVLLYGSAPQKQPHLEESAISCSRFKGVSTADDVLDETLVSGTLPIQIEGTIAFIKKNIRRGWKFKNNAKRKEIYEYPMDAVREAIANAVAHRDYRISAHCQVRIFDDRIEVWSPGNLVDKLSIDDLKKDHISHPRNRQLAKHLYASKYIEKKGFGTTKILKRMMDADLKEPEFANTGSDFKVTLYGPGDDFLEKKAIRPLVIPEKYKEWLRRFHSTMGTDLLAAKGEVITVSLPEVYIPLKTVNPFYGIDGFEEEAFEIDIETLAGRNYFILLRGGAGTGKTTFIKHLAYTITNGTASPELTGYLPVVVFLKNFWPIYSEETQKAKTNLTFEDLLPIYLERSQCPLPMEDVRNYLQHSKVLFLIDGLDEIPERLRTEIIDIIAPFQFMNGANRFLLTGRPHGVAGKAEALFGDSLHDVQSLDETMASEFIVKWFRAVSGQASGKGEVTAEAMISDMKQNEHIAVFFQNPLLLTAVCILYQDGNRIPDHRADLYNRVVGNLIYRRFYDPARPGMESKVLEYLMHLAFTAHQKNLKTIAIEEAAELLTHTFEKNLNESDAEYKLRIFRLFDQIEPASGLFTRYGSDGIEFNHLSFQEFLAAKHLVYMGIDWQPFLHNHWWQEALLLHIGLISLDRKREANRVVKTILTIAEEDRQKNNATGLQLLASVALCDLLPSKREAGVVSLACEKLYHIMESEENIPKRVDAGVMVGQLGDERTWNDNMVTVPEGEFIRGSNEAGEDQKPEQRIFLDAFMVGAFLVTNLEYRSFIDAGGYQEIEFWSDQGWKWRKVEDVTHPFRWNDQLWNRPNFPVVGISWYEASAYTDWFSKETGAIYRLPTEAEWEKAARGTDGRKYPWGNQFDGKLLNSKESGVDSTSPVGVFPADKSQYGCYDMAGNVSEWCADWYASDYYKISPSRNPSGPQNGSHRIFRGGSFTGSFQLHSLAHRGQAPAEARDVGIGFRLVKQL